MFIENKAKCLRAVVYFGGGKLFNSKTWTLTNLHTLLRSENFASVCSYSGVNPVNNFEGVHRDFTYWVDSMKFETETSYVNYTRRLRALVTQVCATTIYGCERRRFCTKNRVLRLGFIGS